ncbi:MAG TPA: adenylyl-sulfate kinase [Hyphomicrobiaceae bacterium]|nr:adenylyl-sulfate kinase [Hyphomicrobiaceae bacterium]
MHKKILVMGLPGAGKTTLSKVLAPRLNAVHFNADEVRANINKDLGFSEADRIEQARRMGWLCDQVVKVGCFAIADFICPTTATRQAFVEGGPAFVIWIDRIDASRFEDTNRLFVAPDKFDVRVGPQGTPEYWAEEAIKLLRPVFDPKKPTALFVGRYQPFHEGHKALICEGIRRVGQACVAVRNTHELDAKNPYPFEHVRARIEHALRQFEGRFVVVPLPNITNIFYGRDVGYRIERIELDAEIERVSATAFRERIASPLHGVPKSGS